MTIFLTLAKYFLKIKITQASDASIQADQSTFNQWAKKLGYGRNEELSQAKRDIFNSLLQQIEHLENQDNDEENLKALCALIDDAIISNTEQSEFFNQNGGTTDKFLRDTKSLVNGISTYMDRYHFLDIDKNDNPTNIFTYFVCLYLVKGFVKDFYAHEKTMDNYFGLGLFLNDPKLSDNNKIKLQKQQFAIEILADCRQDLQSLDTDNEQFEENCRGKVFQWIGILLKTNSVLCKNHYRGLGSLDTLMREAQAVLRQQGNIPGDVNKYISQILPLQNDGLEAGGPSSEEREEPNPNF